MAHDLLSYFDRRFEKTKNQKSHAGPFLTFSRQTGCNGSGIATDLVKALKEHGKTWKFINKEVMEESALKLKMDPSKVKYVFESKKKSHVDDVLSALSSRYYKSDKTVRNTIAEVLKHFAEVGNIILVGRAGVASTSEVKNGLHIRFTAPYEWRLNALKKRKEFEKLDVATFIKEHDEKKRKLIKDFSGKEIHDIHFDLTIDTATFNRQQTIALIIEAMKMKQMI